MKPYRTVLFVPAHKTSWYEKAVGVGRRRGLFRPRGLRTRTPQGVRAQRGRRRRRRALPEPPEHGTVRPHQLARHPADGPRSRGDRRTRADRDLRAQGRRGHRRDPVRHLARPLRGARRGQRARVHRPGGDDPGHPALRGDRGRVATGRRDDRADRRTCRHRQGGRLRMVTRRSGVASPPHADPAGDSRRRTVIR